MDENRFDLIFLPERDNRSGLAVNADVIGWSLLKRTMVVADAAEAEVYYRELHRNGVSRLAVMRATLDEDAFAAEALARRSGPFAGLASPDVFQPVALADFPPAMGDLLQEVLSVVRQHAPLADGESPLPACEIGVAARQIGPLAAGTVLIRKNGRLPSHYVAPHLMANVASRSVTTVSLSQFAPELLTEGPQILGRSPQIRDATEDTILQTLSALTGALSYLPTVGPIFGILQGVFSIISVIQGSDSSSQFEQMLGALRSIINDALIQSSIREQLGHVATFMDQYRSDQATLAQSTNRPNYILTTYLPLLNNQLNDTGSGTVNNAVHQLKKMYDDTPWTKIKVVEQILAALGLGVGYRMLIHRTRVMLYAELAADADKRGDKAGYETYKASMLDSLHQFADVVNNSDASARDLMELMNAYHDKRFEESSVYWGYKDNFLYYTFYVCDRLDNDTTLEWANFWGSLSEGQDWARRTRNAYYSSITSAASSNVMPIHARAGEMLSGYYQLKRRTYEQADPVFKAATVWTGDAAFFFADNKYTKLVVSTEESHGPYYPASVIGNNWPGLPSAFATPDAVIRWNSSKAYFFKGDEYVAYDVVNDQVISGYPRKIVGNWAGWPANFTNIDAALPWSDDVCYFFKGDEYIAYDIKNDRVSTGYPRKIVSNWSGWPANFVNVDCAVKWNNGYAYIFKGDKYIRYSISSDKFSGGPYSISSGWPALYWW